MQEMSPENSQLIQYGFKEIDTNLFTNDKYILVIYDDEFEIYCDPEYDLRYYHDKIDKLDYILSNL